MLKPIKHRNIADQVYEQLRDMIYRGQYRPGERLMPERDMASFFKVARPTVRAAIQRLIEQGLIESKRGVGTFVVQNNQDMRHNYLFQILINEPFTIVEFQEVRMALEAKSAELAAKRATDEDIRMIKQCLERIEMERNEESSKMETELSFHMNIAYASKNIVQIHLMKGFYDVQIYAMSFAYETLYSTMKIDGLMDQQHNSIFEAICEHDPDRARKLIEEHIGTLMEIWREHNL